MRTLILFVIWLTLWNIQTELHEMNQNIKSAQTTTNTGRTE